MDKQPRKEIWIKNWSGNWGLLFCSFYGRTYTYGLKKYFGKYFKKFFVQFESGVGSNYLLSRSLTDIGTHFSNIIIQDESRAKGWVESSLRRANKLKSLIKRLQNKKTISIREYKTMRDMIHNFTPCNFAIKRVVDYLPLKLQEKLLPDFEHVRVYTEDIYNNVDEILRKMLKQVSGQTGYPVKFLDTITYVELERYFTTSKLPKLQELKLRYAGVAVFYENDKEKIIFGKKFQNLKGVILKKLISNQIKGTPAYPGKARGKVRVILDPKSVKIFNKGDVLVAGMTRPEYLGLMKKSGAFITDAGGMLSHAAIVARELKKPCIVGTEIATKILKDGDLVEVDANKGIIKKIK